MTDSKKYEIRLKDGTIREVSKEVYDKVKSSTSGKPNVINAKQREVSEREGKKAASALKSAGKFAYQLPIAAGAGALQGGGEMLRSLGNLPLEGYNLVAGKNHHLPTFDLKQYLEPGAGTDIGYGGGKLGSELYGGAKAFQLANKLIGPRATALGKIGKHAALGPGLGFALGETQDNNRMLGTLAGLLGPLSQAPKITNKNVGKSVLNRASEQRGISSLEYDPIFNELEELGIKNNPFGLDAHELAVFEAGAPHDITQALKKYIENPSLKNEHSLQSVMNSFSHRLRNKSGLGDAERKAVNLAGEIGPKIRNKFQATVSEQGGDDLYHALLKANANYEKNVGPYASNESIRNAENYQAPRSHKLMKKLYEQGLVPLNTKQGAIPPEELTKQLKGISGAPFRADVGYLHPELQINQALSSPLAKALAGALGATALGGTGAILGKEYLKSSFY